MTDVSGRTALVTGASKGIGAEIAAALGRGGANVVAHYGSDRAGAESATASIPRSAGSSSEPT
jgi:NAD(P)-dependent dehydrogenase (short-subunit alcohol dehydrogenase family)